MYLKILYRNSARMSTILHLKDILFAMCSFFDLHMLGFSVKMVETDIDIGEAL